MKILNEGYSDGQKSRAYEIHDILLDYNMLVESCELGDTSERFNIRMPNGDLVEFGGLGNRVDGGWLNVKILKKHKSNNTAG